MAKRKIRIGVEDQDGTKTEIRIEGNITQERILRALEAVKLTDIEQEAGPPSSVKGKVLRVVDKFYPAGQFRSSDVLEKYEDEYNEPIKHSVVATYLARHTSENRLARTKAGREWLYTRQG